MFPAWDHTERGSPTIHMAKFSEEIRKAAGMSEEPLLSITLYEYSLYLPVNSHYKSVISSHVY